MSENDFFTIFVFPFKYDCKERKDLTPFNAAEKLLKEPANSWVPEHFKLSNAENYNEFNYFHPFVRQVIFNRDKNSGMDYLKRIDYIRLEVVFCKKSRLEDAVKKLDEKTQLAFFNLRTRYEEFFYEKTPEGLVTRIKNDFYANDSVKEQLIRLVIDNWVIGTVTTDVKSIDLHLFDNQIGLLTITTEKKDKDKNVITFDDFLRYNDIARRVYPPYLGPKHNTDTLKYDTNLLPISIELLKENGEGIKECFDPVKLATEGKDILYLSEIIQKLLLPFKLQEKDYKAMGEIKDHTAIYFTPFTDDRMFIVSYYADKALANKISKRCCDSYVYENSTDWYQYIFVDGNFPNIANPALMKELIRKHTYNRWVNLGSLYGICRYSLVMMGDNSEFCKNVLKQHMKSMYYQMALIVLFQRAMLLKFSDDIFHITSQKLNLEDLQEHTSKLHGNFIKFINKYWFIEVTPQEQGIEMYNQWIGLLNLDKLYQEVEKEISELAKHVDNKVEFEIMRAETKRTKRIEMITLYGFPLAVIALIIALWQAYAPAFDSFKSLYTGAGIKEFINDFRLLNSFILLVPACVIAYFVTRIFIRKKLNKISSKTKIPGLPD